MLAAQPGRKMVVNIPTPQEKRDKRYKRTDAGHQSCYPLFSICFADLHPAPDTEPDIQENDCEIKQRAHLNRE